ncbi:MAG TPA: hypothetical protein VHB20_05615 [Verrucomicrobiae bacterium]|jgi:hypothetical protein|nr:hypothetical protein [Verrucomicrobiae bacterium]
MNKLTLLLLALTSSMQAGTIAIPNASFESPQQPTNSPYASFEMDSWQKPPAPPWYDPSQNQDTPWEYLMGGFYNSPDDGAYIVNCDGVQDAFVYGVPETGFFQDLAATYQTGKVYRLTVGIIGGGGGMPQGASFEIGLYYRDTSNNFVTIAATVVSNTTATFPDNLHFVDFAALSPRVGASDAWAGQPIGVELLNATGFDKPGGYWDLDNVRLLEITPPALTSGGVTNGQFTFSIAGEAGAQYEIQAAVNLSSNPGDWLSLGTVSNATGSVSFTDTKAGASQRFYRVRHF